MGIRTGTITTTHFRCGKDKITVRVEDHPRRFRWKMCVNGSWSNWHYHYQGLLFHKGYGLGTAYWWNIEIKEFIPFKIIHGEKDTQRPDQIRRIT